MPIYAYKCESCGYAKDILQKMSDSLLTDCPHCGSATFKKQLTAAGFQLKGSGWYVTDFRGGNNGASAATKSADSEPGSDTKATDGAASAPATPAATPTAAPAAAAATLAGNKSAGGDASSKPA